jgi:hypothetical protein
MATKPLTALEAVSNRLIQTGLGIITSGAPILYLDASQAHQIDMLCQGLHIWIKSCHDWFADCVQIALSYDTETVKTNHLFIALTRS